MAKASASRLRKTHNLTFDSKQLFYPWHRWYGREILTRKATGPYSEQVFWCRLPDDAPDVMLIAIPRWMFDASTCATMRRGDRPIADCTGLRALRDLIGELRAGAPRTVLQHQASQPENDGDADANDNPQSISNQSAHDVLRESTAAALAESAAISASRSDQKSRSASVQRSRKPPRRRRSSKRRRAR
jgi:hypothetical protein